MVDFSTRTIGILGGMGPAASANFQQLLVAEINRAGAVTDTEFPRIISFSIPLKEWNHLGAVDKEAVENQIKDNYIHLAAKYNPDLIAIPCNTIHEFIPAVDRVVNIIHETLVQCATAETIGILCSKQTRESRLYELTKNQKYVYIENQSAIDEIIAAVMAGQRPVLRRPILELIDCRVDAIVLGCTELSLCPRPGFAMIVDSSQALAAGVVKRLQQL